MILLSALLPLTLVVKAVEVNRPKPVVGDFVDDLTSIMSVIDNIFSSTGLDAYLGDEAACFDNVENLLWYGYYSY